jgi:hypothetical protein
LECTSREGRKDELWEVEEGMGKMADGARDFLVIDISLVEMRTSKRTNCSPNHHSLAAQSYISSLSF